MSSMSDGTLQFYNRFFLIKLFILSNWSVIETNNGLEYEYYTMNIKDIDNGEKFRGNDV